MLSCRSILSSLAWVRNETSTALPAEPRVSTPLTTQLTAIYLFALYLAKVRGAISDEQAEHAMHERTLIPGKLEHLLTHEERRPKSWPKSMSALRIFCFWDEAFTTQLHLKVR